MKAKGHVFNPLSGRWYIWPDRSMPDESAVFRLCIGQSNEPEAVSLLAAPLSEQLVAVARQIGGVLQVDSPMLARQAVALPQNAAEVWPGLFSESLLLLAAGGAIGENIAVFGVPAESMSMPRWMWPEPKWMW